MAEARAQECDQRRELGVVEGAAKSRHHLAFFTLARMDAVEGDPDQVGRCRVGHRSTVAERDAAPAAIMTVGASGAIDRVAILGLTGIGRRRVIAARGSFHIGCALTVRSAGGGRTRARAGCHPCRDIHGDGIHFGFGRGRKIMRDRRHRARGSAMRGVEARAQICDQLLGRPQRRRRRGLIERRCSPAFDGPAGEILPLLFGAKHIARRVAAAAVSQAVDQIASAVPVCVVGGVGRERSRLEVKGLPDGDRRPGHQYAVGGRFRTHRIARHEERVNGIDVLVGDMREVVVRKCRIEIATVSVDALMHRSQKVRR